MKGADRRAPQGDEPSRQRLIGLGIVLTVLLAAIFVGAARGKMTGGVGLAHPVASAPAMGDCLAQDFRKSGVDLTARGPELPFLELGPCTGARFGEVVYVDADFGHAMATTDTTVNPYHRCRTEAGRYLGMPPRPDPDEGLPVAPTASDPAFWTAIDVLVALIGPDSRQLAAGQRWAACVVYLPVSVVGQRPITVDHSLQGSWRRDGDKNLFSLCVSTPTSHFGANCHWPHRFEMIEMRWNTPGVPQLAIDNQCRESVIEAIGSTAVDGGTVTSVVVPVRPTTNGNGGIVSGPDVVTADDPYLNVCLVRATDNDRQLTAALRGIGDKPVPLK